MTSFPEINSTYGIDLNSVHKSTMIPKVHNPQFFFRLNGTVPAVTSPDVEEKNIIYTLNIF